MLVLTGGCGLGKREGGCGWVVGWWVMIIIHGKGRDNFV